MLKAPGWAARHFWDLELSAGQERSLGALELRHGSTLTGQVTTVDGFADPRLTRVWAVPAGSMPRRLRLDELRGGRLGSVAKLNDQGFFLFENLRPGAYVLVAHQPGLAVHDRVNVLLEDNRETSLRAPILLTHPTRILVEIDPAIGVEEEPWQIRVYRQEAAGTSLDSIASGVTEEGSWQDSSLLAGTYFVSVRDSQGSSWAREGPITVDTGDEIYLPISLDLVAVEGEVVLDDEPIASASLWFGGRNGETSLKTKTDEEGRYRVVLPKAGLWDLEVLAPEPPLGHITEVIVPEEGGELDVRLPATRMSGRVTTPDGETPQPLPSVAANRIGGHGATLPMEVSAEGRFEMRGMDPGTYVLQAESPQGSSDVVTVSVEADIETPELTLVLRASKLVEGRVMAGAEGVPGAQVLMAPFSARGRLLDSSSPSLVADSAGRFEARLPEEADRLHLIVLPPGFGLTVLRSGSEPGMIGVAPADGRIQLQNLSANDGAATAVLLINDLAVGLQILAQWAEMNGEPSPSLEEFTVPAMPSGVYRLCRVDPSELILVYAGQALPTRCSSGVLSSGGQLTLSLP